MANSETVVAAGDVLRVDEERMDLTKVFDDVCAYQAIIETPAQMPRMAEIAVQKALVERC